MNFPMAAFGVFHLISSDQMVAWRGWGDATDSGTGNRISLNLPWARFQIGAIIPGASLAAA